MLGSSEVLILHCYGIFFFLADVVNPGLAGTCQLGMNYPTFCPRPEDPPSYTKCCRHYYAQSCCEERATTICGARAHGGSSVKKSYSHDPGPDYAVLFCPQPGDADDKTLCSFTASGNSVTIHCLSSTLLFGIVGGVLGLLLIIGITITAVCCYKVKTGQWKCVKVRPGKYTMVRVRGTNQSSAIPRTQTDNRSVYPEAHTMFYPDTKSEYFRKNFGMGPNAHTSTTNVDPNRF